jgi:hypothetical protein
MSSEARQNDGVFALALDWHNRHERLSIYSREDCKIREIRIDSSLTIRVTEAIPSVGERSDDGVEEQALTNQSFASVPDVRNSSYAQDAIRF